MPSCLYQEQDALLSDRVSPWSVCPLNSLGNEKPSLTLLTWVGYTSCCRALSEMQASQLRTGVTPNYLENIILFKKSRFPEMECPTYRLIWVRDADKPLMLQKCEWCWKRRAEVANVSFNFSATCAWLRSIHSWQCGHSILF